MVGPTRTKQEKAKEKQKQKSKTPAGISTRSATRAESMTEISVTDDLSIDEVKRAAKSQRIELAQGSESAAVAAKRLAANELVHVRRLEELARNEAGHFKILTSAIEELQQRTEMMHEFAAEMNEELARSIAELKTSFAPDTLAQVTKRCMELTEGYKELRTFVSKNAGLITTPQRDLIVKAVREALLGHAEHDLATDGAQAEMGDLTHATLPPLQLPSRSSEQTAAAQIAAPTTKQVVGGNRQGTKRRQSAPEVNIPRAKRVAMAGITGVQPGGSHVDIYLGGPQGPPKLPQDDTPANGLRKLLTGVLTNDGGAGAEIRSVQPARMDNRYLSVRMNNAQAGETFITAWERVRQKQPLFQGVVATHTIPVTIPAFDVRSFLPRGE